MKKRYYRRSEKTFFSLYDTLHLALAEKHCGLLLTPDSDFRDMTEIKVDSLKHSSKFKRRDSQMEPQGDNIQRRSD